MLFELRELGVRDTMTYFRLQIYGFEANPALEKPVVPRPQLSARRLESVLATPEIMLIVSRCEEELFSFECSRTPRGLVIKETLVRFPLGLSIGILRVPRWGVAPARLRHPDLIECVRIVLDRIIIVKIGH